MPNFEESLSIVLKRWQLEQIPAVSQERRKLWTAIANCERINGIILPDEYKVFLDATCGHDTTVVEAFFDFLKIDRVYFASGPTEWPVRYFAFAEWLAQSRVLGIRFLGEHAGPIAFCDDRIPVYSSFRDLIIAMSEPDTLMKLGGW